MAEDARGGAEVARLEAADPDGRDEELRFHIHSGAKDNFVIDGRTGVLSVAPDANLDIQRSGDTYDIQVTNTRRILYLPGKLVEFLGKEWLQITFMPFYLLSPTELAL